MGMRFRVGDRRTETFVYDGSCAQAPTSAEKLGVQDTSEPGEIRVAESAGAPKMPAHRLVNIGAPGRVLTDWIGGGRLTEFGVRFVSPAQRGEILTTTAAVAAVRIGRIGGPLVEFSLMTSNQQGLPVVIGKATAEFGSVRDPDDSNSTETTSSADNDKDMN